MKHIKEYDEFINEAALPKDGYYESEEVTEARDWGTYGEFGDKKAVNTVRKTLDKALQKFVLALDKANKEYQSAIQQFTTGAKEEIGNKSGFNDSDGRYAVSAYTEKAIQQVFGSSLNYNTDFMYESNESLNEAKYNTVEKVLKKLGRRPSEQELASFITKNYYDVTGVKRGDDDPSRNEKIADLISFYNFDPADFEIAWHYAQNESVNEGRSINAIQKEWAKTTTKMKELAQKFKTAEGDTKSKILSELKDLTKRKKQLERDLDDAVMSKGINQELSSVDEAKYKVNLKADHLSSAEYQKAKKLKAFNPDDWKWNSDEDLYVKTTK